MDVARWRCTSAATLPESAGCLDPSMTCCSTRSIALAVTGRRRCRLDFYPTWVGPIGGPGPQWSVHERVAFAVDDCSTGTNDMTSPLGGGDMNLSLVSRTRFHGLLSLTDGLRRSYHNEGYRSTGSADAAQEIKFDWQSRPGRSRRT